MFDLQRVKKTKKLLLFQVAQHFAYPFSKIANNLLKLSDTLFEFLVLSLNLAHYLLRRTLVLGFRLTLILGLRLTFAILVVLYQVIDLTLDFGEVDNSPLLGNTYNLRFRFQPVQSR